MVYLDYALLVVIAWGLVGFGLNPWLYWPPLALASAFVGGMSLLASRKKGPSGGLLLLLAGFGLLAGATAIQMIPVRRPLILRHSPATDAFLQRASGGYEGLLWSDPPPTHTLSVNPDATLIGLLLLCAFAALLVGTARGLSSQQTQKLAQALPLVGAVAAIIVIAQNFSAGGQEYADRDRLTGWILMALPLGMVQIYGQVHARVSATMRTSTERVMNCAVRASGPVALMVIALAVMAWTAWTGLSATPAGATTTLWGSWDDTWNLIRDFQPAGTGLNTYGTAMMVFQPALHPGAGYNSYLQFAAEGGLLLLVPATLTLLLFGWLVVRRFVERRDEDTMRWIRLAAVAGLALVALYEVVGLSLQVPGNAALFAVLGGIAVRR